MGHPRSGILRHELQPSSFHQKWCRRGLPAHLCSNETHAAGPRVCSAAIMGCQCTPASLFMGPTHIERSSLRESRQIPEGILGLPLAKMASWLAAPLCYDVSLRRAVTQTSYRRDESSLRRQSPLLMRHVDSPSPL